MERNLTTGSVLKNLMFFSLPYLLSYFLQTLYGMADLFIVGQFDGVASTTAVSVGSQVMHMLTVMIVGLAMGTTVTIGQAVGAKNRKKISQTIGNTVILFCIVSVAMMAFFLCMVRPIVAVMSTPAEAVEGTVAYLTICFVGIPCITAYNVISSIFRGMGDSKSPMYFIAIACGANIAFDYIFMGALHLGPAGAALGTTLAQALSVVIALTVILKKKMGISVSRQDFRPRREATGQIVRIGLPIALQDGLIQVAFIIITIIANRRGLSDAAAVGIVEKIISFVPCAILHAVCGICPRCTEYRSRKTGARRADTVLFHRDYRRFRCDHIYYHTVCSCTGGGTVYGRCCSGCAWNPVYQRIHLGLHFCGHPFQFQRLFLCDRQIGTVLYP